MCIRDRLTDIRQVNSPFNLRSLFVPAVGDPEVEITISVTDSNSNTYDATYKTYVVDPNLPALGNSMLGGPWRVR